MCLLVGVVGGLFTKSSVQTWYALLTKPWFTPPNWVFAPVWTALYVLMAVAAFLVWRKGLNDRKVRRAMGWFVAQLSLNALWTPVFFGLHSLLGGMVVISLLWFAILVTMMNFGRISRAAGILLAPYLYWVTFAAVLNAEIFSMNVR